MDNNNGRSYDKLISYVKTKILNKEFVVGDKLPSERDLAAKLEISRNSVREGIRILDRMGVIYSQHGAGNYISSQFDRTMTEVMSMMYVLKGMNMEEITDFRFGLEYGAVNLAVENATDNQKKLMLDLLKDMEQADTEQERAKKDKRLHYLIVESSENTYIISTFNALNHIMENYVPEMREKIFIGMKTEEELASSHRKIVNGIVNGNLEEALEGLFNHFKYIRQFIEVELEL